MPNLRLESHTPTEAEKEIEQLKDQLQTQNAEIKELKQILQPWTEILKAVSKNGSVEIVRQNDNQPLGQIQYGTEKELDERMRALEDQFKKLNERHSK